MTTNKPLTIGILVDDVFSDFAKDIIHSAINAVPLNREVKVVIIAGKYIYEGDPNAFDYPYKKIYNSICMLGELCNIDGLIISLGSIDPHEKDLFMKKYQTNYEGIPKVLVAAELDGYVTVNYDNEMGVREAIDFLINAKSCSHLCMLGGRDDNGDAMKRKNIFIESLKAHDIEFDESTYEATGMDINCEVQADALLERNPNCDAIFCVNDAVARGLYDAMEKRNLIPGKDIYVFGFDNTLMAGDMIPSLSSIGASNEILGQKAVEVLIDMLDGKEVTSVLLPTRLYGRESLGYESYQYSALELNQIDRPLIDKMFNDCFYRYANEKVDKRNVDLKRLFTEIASRMLLAMRNKYMSIDDYQQVSRMIDVFFENGIMEYTDTSKLVNSIDRFQASMNVLVKSPSANIMNNRLFSYMKNKAIRYISTIYKHELDAHNAGRETMIEFLISGINFDPSGLEHENPTDRIVRSFNKLGINNAAFYMYREPIIYDYNNPRAELFPSEIDLRCVIKNGDIYVLPKERRATPVPNMFERDELSSDCKGFVVFPIFHGHYIHGMLLCEATPDIFDRGEFIAFQIARAIHDAWLTNKKIDEMRRDQ